MKFLKPPLSLSKPQLFPARFHLIVKCRNQPLSKLDAISQRKLHGVCGESIKIRTYVVRTAEESDIDKVLTGSRLLSPESRSSSLG